MTTTQSVQLFDVTVVHDTLFGYRSPGRRDWDRIRLPVAEVKSLRVSRFSGTRTAALGLSAVATGVVVYVLRPKAQLLYGASVRYAPE